MIGCNRRDHVGESPIMIPTGSAHAAPALRPLFQWKPVDGATSYELQVDNNCPTTDFASCSLPSPAMTRWHGIATASLFAPQAWATARTAFGIPINFAISE